ncbi:alpha/beta fold hydrolase [Brevibacterium litoralis]|uniref:alpha/beta fold hydrolase n=1 Tax=Brevibacterium litoralis TaxID=3138935 RepID=UPI0032EBE946
MRWPASPASLPGPLPEWDSTWSRLVTAPTVDGDRTFHVLDTLPALREAGIEPAGTILALHGNPTWSYLWRHLAAATLTQARAGFRAWRLIAPDQLEMGFSERLDHAGLPTTHGPGHRRIPERLADFDAVVTTLLAEAPAGVNHPLVTIGHDWGGVLSLTWAARHLDVVDAVMTLNTAVHHPEGEPIPAPLQAALAGPMLPTSTVRTDWFLGVTLGLGQGPLSPQVKDAFRAPYRTAERRVGIGQFVADIPAQETHPSYDELQRLGEDISGIDVPALMIWGPKDPVFVERYQRDLRERLPQADVHRFETASHLVSEDADVAGTVLTWLGGHFPDVDGADARAEAVTGTGTAHSAGTSAAEFRPAFADLDARRDRTLASVDMTQDPPQAVTRAQLGAVVDAMARGLVDRGLRPGDRVSLLVPPGNDLTAALYAVLKAGGVAVVADAGLGPAGMTRAVKAADPQWIIGQPPGLTLARGAGWPGRRLSVTPLGPLRRKALGTETSLTELVRAEDRTAHVALPAIGPDDDAAVLFTSGSTGPAKGVRYTHGRLAALADLLRERFDIRPGDGLVAGFPPFALLGPAIGATSVTPDMSVTKPRTLTAAALADAVAAGDCTMVFASPAAYRNVVATAGDLTAEQRAACARVELVLSAGAPVPLELMDAVVGGGVAEAPAGSVPPVFPNAEFHSPYGMTEGLLLTDIDREGVAAARAASETAGSRDHGVCVGAPLPQVRLALAPLGPDGTPSEDLLEGPGARGILGEFVVSAAHVKAGYDRLWATDSASKRDTVDGLVWHRTNDIGHLDAEGRVWLEGRTQHVVVPPSGPVGPGGVEAVVDRLPQVYRSALVGVGPVGTQALVVVLEPEDGTGLKVGPAPLVLVDEVRAAVAESFPDLDVAAVLVAGDFPTDIRHNSKIDRPRLARWADRVLAGGSLGRP